MTAFLDHKKRKWFDEWEYTLREGKDQWGYLALDFKNISFEYFSGVFEVLFLV